MHNLLVKVRGIGTKIASFYMRDIAYLSQLDENNIRDSHVLQPIDTWIKQTLSIILPDAPKKLTQKQHIIKQHMIVDLCMKAGVSHLAFNQGAWVLGSQIAKDYNTFRTMLVDNAQPIIRKTIDETEIYLHEMRKILSEYE